MSRADAERWDEKWSARLAHPPRPRRLLTAHRALLGGGLALDLACGPGQNACWLAQRGYRVLGVDISQVALRAGQERARELGLGGRILWLQADLDHWRPPPATFDLICVFRFLERAVLPSIRAAVRSGGWLFYATRHVGVRGGHEGVRGRDEGVRDRQVSVRDRHANVRGRQPEANLRYLLRRGELAGAFAGWAIVHAFEGRADASVIAGHPGVG